MLTLLGALLGFFSSSFPEVLKFFNQKRDRAHELAIMDRQIELSKSGQVSRLEEVRLQAASAEQVALYQHARRSNIKQTSLWVDALSSSVRPVITYAFFGLYGIIKVSQTRVSQLSSKGLTLIKQFEGFRPEAYLCSAGCQTIGYGHIIKEGEVFSQPLKESQAEALLLQDVEVTAKAIYRLITIPLTQGQFDALVSFTFNCGAGALQRSTLRACVNRQEHMQVPAELLKWSRVKGGLSNGLMRRRMAEALLYVIPISKTFDAS